MLRLPGYNEKTSRCTITGLAGTANRRLHMFAHVHLSEVHVVGIMCGQIVHGATSATQTYACLKRSAMGSGPWSKLLEGGMPPDKK